MKLGLVFSPEGLGNRICGPTGVKPRKNPLNLIFYLFKNRKRRLLIDGSFKGKFQANPLYKPQSKDIKKAIIKTIIL